MQATAAKVSERASRPGSLDPSVRKHRAYKKLASLMEGLRGRTTLTGRLEAIQQLVRWLEDKGAAPLVEGAERTHARPHLLLRALEDDLGWRASFGEVMGSVLAETTALRLFCHAGLPVDPGFMGEALDRVARRFLPFPRDERDLAELFSVIFPTERHVRWIEELPPALLERLAGAVQVDDGPDQWGPVWECVKDSIAMLGTRVSALGLSEEIRARSPSTPPRESVFFRLPRAHDRLIEASGGEGAAAVLAECRTLHQECRAVILAVRSSLERQGVSIDVVYRLEMMEKGLERLDALASLLVPTDGGERHRVAGVLVATLARDRLRDGNLLALVRSNLRLLARKVIERAGSTGEHYITSTRGEYGKMLLSASGGGLLTAGTTALKYLLGWAKFPFFVAGFLAGVNYAASFVVMQLLGFTLATKQPSMTAAALAGSLGRTHGRRQLDELVGMIARIVRSQIAAIIGNIGAVIPAAFALDWLVRRRWGAHYLDVETAHHVLESLDPLHGLTVFYAALTGVLLWSSSVAAGWIENWMVVRRVPEGIAQHRIRRIIGTRATGWLSRFFARNISGFGGNITLGFLLGMTPVFGAFFGLPLDVRHVTLSTGALVLSVCSMGHEALEHGALWHAAVGIAIIGALNFGVSFVLALGVALRARDVARADRWRLMAAVLRRMARSPFEFVFPPKNAESQHGAGHH